MRGRTLDNAYVILDEAQNATIPQIKMFLTRLGRNAKAIVKAIKDSKIKVNASIRGDEVRCESKSIDELRLAMDIVKKMDLDLPIGFKNLK